MPTDIAKAKQMFLSTDYPIDKIVFTLESSVSVAAFGFADIDTPHGMAGIPLVNGFWTTDPTWSTSYEINTGIYINGNLAYRTGVASNSTNVRFSMNNQTGSPVTLYYRIFAFSPEDDSDFDAGATNIYNSFKLNTDYNYPKLYATGRWNEPSTGGGYVTRVIFNHNLGYVPQVQAWQTLGGFTSPITGADAVTGSTTGMEVTETQLIFYFSTFSASTIYYRVYLDEQI